MCQKSMVEPVIPPFFCPIFSASMDNISCNFALQGNATTFTHKMSHIACTRMQQVHKPLETSSHPKFQDRWVFGQTVHVKSLELRNSLVGQWLGPLLRTCVQSLIGDLRFHKPQSIAKWNKTINFWCLLKKKKNIKKRRIWSPASISPTMVPGLRRPLCPPLLWPGRSPIDYLVVLSHWWGCGERGPERQGNLPRSGHINENTETEHRSFGFKL